MNAERYLLAIDAGTTAVKTVLFDLAGREIACRVSEYELEKPHPDTVEVSPEVYWRAAEDGIAGVIREAAIDPREIAAAGVTSQGETLIVLDRDGRPLRNAIVWIDNRAKAEAAQIAARFSREEVYRITGQPEIVPGWTAAKILWLRHHEPEIFKRAAKFLLVEDYLIYRLTGQFATDHALNPSTLYYDLIRGCWWPDMLDFLGIAETQLPELKESGEIAGYAREGTGLAAGTPVCVAPIDQVTAAVGAGNIAPGMVTETTGSAMAICATLDAPVFDPEMRIGLYRHALPGQYLMMVWVPTAGMILRWFRDELAAGRSYDELTALAAQVPAGSDGLLLLPHFSGSFSPEVNPDAAGVFYGLRLAHQQRHFVRAILEATAFMLKQNLEVLEHAGLNYPGVRSLGGGARSPLWLQIKADVLDRPVEVPVGNEATCLGAAILASLGAGLFPSLEAAVKNMVHLRTTLPPRPEQAVAYREFYRKYVTINQLLLPSFGG